MNPALAALIGRHLAAENAQDLPGTLATLHADCRFEDLATGQTWHGHDGAARHYGQWWTTFDVTVKRGPGQLSAWTADDGYIAEASCSAVRSGSPALITTLSGLPISAVTIFMVARSRNPGA